MRIIMTGATSGIGLAAANALLKDGADLIVGARTPARAPAFLRKGARLLPLDLGDLASVRAFVTEVGPLGPFDALLLNAGMQATSDQRSAQGFEMTFAANHLAHYAMIRALAPALSPGGRVVLTASGVHDPEAHTGMPPPRHADANRLAYPETDPQRDANPGAAGRRAYSSSKLCNVMTARALASRLAATRPDLAVAAFDPGFTPGTGLARDYGGAASLLFRFVLPLVIRGENVSTPAASGNALAALTASPGYASARGAYFSMRHKKMKQVEPSALARDDAACTRLWDDSAALLAKAGFPELAA